MSRILRTLICLLLICCILVNVSPLKVRALDPVTVGFVGVSAVVGVACIMQALGYMAASNSEPFTNTVNSCVDYLSDSTSFVTNGMLTFAGYRSGQLSKAYAMRDLVQEVWQWLFSSRSVVSVVGSNTSYSVFIDGETYNYNFSAPVHLFYYDMANTSYLCAFSPYIIDGVQYPKPQYTVNGGAAVVNLQYSGDWNGYYRCVMQSPVGTVSGVPYYGYVSDGGALSVVQSRVFDSFGSLSYESSSGVLGQIQSPYQTVGTDEEIIEIEIAPIYIDLTKEIQEFPDPNNPSDDPDLDKKIPWLPIRIPSKNYDDTVINQTQQESWTGESDVEFEFDYGDSSGNGSGDNTGTNTGTNTGNGSWSPSGDMQHFTLDLKEYFPFCIPFDLYDFFTCLNADPVAPVIEWVIPMPGGDTYPLELDLSTFDPVAQLLRRLQLLLFCVGLAFKTRDLIKG